MSLISKHPGYNKLRQNHCTKVLHKTPKKYTPHKIPPLPLHRRPEVIGVEETGKLRVDIDNMHIALATVPNNRAIEIARLIRLDINTQGAEDFQPQSVNSLESSHTPSTRDPSTHIVASSASRSRRVVSSPSRPCDSRSASRSLSISSSLSSRSLSISSSEAALAMRNFLVSSSTISAACLLESCTATASSCWVVMEWRLRASFLRDVSASRMRRSRDCWRVESESLMRVTACLSGWMLKLPIVWWMS